MALRFSDKPSLHYGSGSPYGDSRYENVMNRFPAHAQPIASAPHSSRPVVVFEPDGSSCRAIYHSGRWRRVESYRDVYSGEVHQKMTSIVNNPVVWTSS
jgi:hypothetical protein